MSSETIFLYVLSHNRCVVEYDDDPEYMNLKDGVEACLMALEDGAEIVVSGDGMREVSFDVLAPLLEAAFDWSPFRLSLYRPRRAR